jgi:hypothetical protein
MQCIPTADQIYINIKTDKTIRTWYEEFTELKIIDAPNLTRVWQELE